MRDFLAQTTDPICFLVGAGASVTSGAPSMAKVEETWVAALGNVARDDLRRTLHKISQDQKRIPLLPLFSDLKPSLGYRLLAKMGRTRQVLVVNLNWDVLIEKACEEMGVQCSSFNLETDSAVEIRGTVERGAHGVVCLHLHGRIDPARKSPDPIQFSLLETLEFDKEQTELLARQFFGRPTFIVGTSLNAAVLADTDMLRLFIAVAQGHRVNEILPPVYLFTRESRYEAITSMLMTRISADNVVSHPSLDFDRLMLELQPDWPPVGKAGSQVLRGTAFAWPDHRFIQKMFDARVISIVGERFIGKSQLALYLGSLLALLRKPVGRVEYITASTNPSVLRDWLQTASAHDVLVMEDGLGRDKLIQPRNSAKRKRGARWRAKRGDISLVLQVIHDALTRQDRPTVILTSRLAVWTQAMKAYSALLHRTVVLTGAADCWYSPSCLLQLGAVNTKGSDHERHRLESLIRRRVFCKPADVDSYFDSERRIRQHNAVVYDKLRMLRKSPRLRTFCALLRLSEFSDWNFYPADIARLLDTTLQELVVSSYGLLRLDTVDGVEHLNFSSPSDRDAADRVLRDGSTYFQLSAANTAPTNKLRGQIPWFDEAFARWRAVERVANLTTLGTRGLTEAECDLIASHIMVRRPRPQVFEEVLRHSKNFWSFRDVVLQVVRNWDNFTQSHSGRDYMRTILSDEVRFGTYALLEACLILGESAPPRIWSRLADRMWEMLESQSATDREFVLLFDGLLWKRTPPNRLDDEDLLRNMIKRSASFPGRRAGFAMAMLYHWERANELKLVRELDPMRVWQQTPQQHRGEAIALIKWHYATSCRAWAQRWSHWNDQDSLNNMRRRRAKNKMSDYLSSHLSAAAVALEDLDPGWIFFLLINLSCIHGDYGDTDRLREILGRCKRGDEGVIAAAMSHELPDALVGDVKHHFRDARGAFLDGVKNGIRVDDINLKAPGFKICADIYDVEHVVGIRWPLINGYGIDTSSAPTLYERIRPKIREAIMEHEVEPKSLIPLLNWLQSGDLRPLNGVIEHRGEPDSPKPILDLVISAASFTSVKME